jgi:hypothetical protein
MRILLLTCAALLNSIIPSIAQNLDWTIKLDIINIKDLSDDTTFETRELETNILLNSIQLTNPIHIATNWNGNTYTNPQGTRGLNATSLIETTMKNTVGMLLPLTEGENSYIFEATLYAIVDCTTLNASNLGNIPIQCATEGSIILLDRIIISGQTLIVDTGDCKSSSRGFIHHPVEIKSIARDYNEYRAQLIYLSTNGNTVELADKNSDNQNIQRPEYNWENLPNIDILDPTTLPDKLATHPKFTFENISNIGGSPFSTNLNTVTPVSIILKDLTNTTTPPLAYNTYINSLPSNLDWLGLLLWVADANTEQFPVNRIDLELYPEPEVIMSYKQNSGDIETSGLKTFLENGGVPFNDAADLPAELIFEFSNLYPVNTTSVSLILPNGTTNQWFLSNNQNSGRIDGIPLNTLALIPGNYTLKISHIVPLGDSLPASFDYNGNPELDICATEEESITLSFTFSIGSVSTGTINLQ